MSTNVRTSFRFVYSSFIYLHEVGEIGSLIQILPSLLCNIDISTERYNSHRIDLDSSMKHLCFISLCVFPLFEHSSLSVYSLFVW